MTTPFSAAKYSELLELLNRGIAERVAGERRLAELQSDEAQGDLEPGEVQERLNQLEAERQQHVTEAGDVYTRFVAEIDSQYQSEAAAVEAEARRERSQAVDSFESEIAGVEERYDENRWIMTSLVDESADTNPKKQLETFKTQIERLEERMSNDWEELNQISEQAIQTVRDRRHWREEPVPALEKPGSNRDEAQKRFDDAASEARVLFEKLNRQFLSRMLSGPGVIAAGLILWLPAFGILGWLVDPAAIGLKGLAGVPWILTAAGVTFAVSALVLTALWMAASRKTWETFGPFRIHVSDAYQNYKQWRKFAKSELARMEKTCDERHQALIAHRENSLQRFTAERDEKLKALTEERAARLAGIDADRSAKLTAIAEAHQRDRAAADFGYQNQIDQIQAHFDAQRQQLTGELEQYEQERARQISECKIRMQSAWLAAVHYVRKNAYELNQQSRALFPEWSEILAEDWQPPTEVPEGIRIGSYVLDLTRMPQGMPSAAECIPETTAFTLPAVLPFPHSPSFILKTSAGGRGEAVAIQQAALLRIMSQLPPATVRLTICDPVGLGEPFAAFMHLADFDELLITNRIWTETAHIEEQLAKLTEHLENVFQKYLRNEFETIEEYNQKAGEVAEPYRILVVAGFPHGFSERAAQRLASIAASGPRCGVYLFLSVDTRQQMPRGFQLADVEANATVFRWEQGNFVTDDFGKPPLPLRPDPPPESAEFTSLVRKLGELSRSIRRVEVPFYRICPSEDRIWKADSRRTVDVALGRSGATKHQHLQLGLGTSQHVLVAGKTGSGKSTLLHVLVTNLALNYSPDEIEFYLIDFKKGVEFKTYATLKLPHARVIAIESDREFGVSVLERLDGILKERGELFREHGVQDIQSFRNNVPDTPMPRILLVVDEFQEFFTEDDRVYQTASLLLDRLVRQGRAFGIHVLLGSQTLGGAYSLARTTISQMAVRIALQCSETDAHLILSEDNTAARLLTRPGEAIYNDANGMMEGNSLFQIAWLNDDERDRLLRPLQDLAKAEGLDGRPMIVFEGNIPADASRNPVLARQIESAKDLDPAALPTQVRGWIGEPVSITKSTAVTFRRQPASHLLIVGTEMSPAAGLMTTCLVGLAAQVPVPHKPEALPFAYLLNGHAGESVDADWKRICEAIPQRMETVDFHQVGEAMSAICEEIRRRQESPGSAYPPMFVVVFDLSRYRDLAKSDDDFGLRGFGSSDQPQKPSQLFAEILREGSAVGVHVILWCNSYNNVDRALGRSLLKEFEMRVAFQMSAGDSSSLIDNAAASRLGQHRALLYRDDQGTIEKFRPYGRPSEDWLSQVRERLGPAELESPQEEPEPLQTLDDINDLTIS